MTLIVTNAIRQLEKEKATLLEQARRLSKAINTLSSRKTHRGHAMSKNARHRIALAQRERWAKVRKTERKGVHVMKRAA
jgi:hypothetical protein